MAFTPTTNLSLPLIDTGTESGTWGELVDNGLTSYLDIAIAGGLAITITTADVTLTKTAGTSSVTNIGATTAQYAILNISGAKTAARNLTLPASSKWYIINNAGTGGFLLTVRGAGPTTGVTLVDGEKAIVAWNGSDFVKVSTDLAGVPAINGGQLAGLRNRIINGGAVINQRVSAAVGTVGVYSADRWIVAIIGGTGITATSNNGGLVGSPSGFGVYIGGTWTSGKPVFAQRIESYNAQDLVGKTITISGYINAPVGINDTYDIILVAPTATDNYASTTAIGTNTTATITGGTTTFFSTTFSATTMNVANIIYGLQLQIQKTNAVSHGTTVNYALGGAQLEIGPVATTFEQRPIGLELALCQRYYETGFAEQLNNTGASATVGFTTFYRVTKRAVPSTISLTLGAVVNSVSASFSSSQAAIASGTYYQFNWTSTAEL
jgi:hypothetical protein